MNCPSCNFKNIEENRFCIMCGTPLEGGGASSDTTGSLDLSASLPGGADIDFSGLMDQVSTEGGAGLFDAFDEGGAMANSGGSLDLMLSDFEGNLAALTESGQGPAMGEGVPPPSGGEGWGGGGDDFSFSDMGKLDPTAHSDDVVLPKVGGAPAESGPLGAGDPLDFSFSSDTLGGGLDFSDLTGSQPEAAPAFPAGPPAGREALDLGDDLFGGGGGGTGAGTELNFDSVGPGTGLDFGDAPTSELPFDQEDSYADLAGFESLAAPPAASRPPARPPAAAPEGTDDLDALLQEIDDVDAGDAGGAALTDVAPRVPAARPAAARPPTGRAPAVSPTSTEDDAVVAELFEEPAAPGPAGGALTESGLLFEEPPPGRPAAKPSAADQSVSGFDDLDAFFQSTDGAPSAAGSDDLDDFLAGLEGEAVPPGTETIDTLDLDGIVAGGPPKAAGGRPPKGMVAPGGTPVAPKPKPKPKAPVKPAADASDDEIAALIAGMESARVEPEPEDDAALLLDDGEEAPPTGSALDDFLDELTDGVVPPTPSRTGAAQPMVAGMPAPTPLTTVPARLEEIDPKVLLQQLSKAKDEDRRYQIVQRLAQLQHPDTSADFLHLVNDKNLDIRECAVEALGNLEDEEAVRPLLKVLKTERGNIRYLSVEALGKLASREATEPLIQLLREDDENMAYVVAEALGRIGDDRAVRPLITLCSTADKDLRYVIATSLGAIGSTEATPLLLSLLRDDDLEVRTQAIRALGELADPDGAGALLDFLDEEMDDELVLEAVRSLGRMRAMAAVRHLLAMLRAKREELIVEIMNALGQIRAAECVGPMVERLEGEVSLPIQIAAIRALGEIGEGAGVPALADLLEQNKLPLKVPIAEALAKIKVPEALAPLEELLHDADVVVRKNAVQGIGELQNPSSVSHLERLVKDPDEGVRQACAVALGKIGVEECLPLLQSLLRDSEPAVSDAAVEGLELIGTPAVDSLVATLEREAEHEEMVLKITRVLGSIGDIRGLNPLLEAFEDAGDEARVKIAEALSAIDRKLIETGRISTLIKEGYAWCRFRVAEALGRQGFDAAVELLLDIIEETYTDEDEKRLRHFPDGGILVVNREALDGVRSAAARLLGQLNLSDTVKAILARLVRVEGETRLWLVRCLGSVHKEASVSALIELVKKEDSGIPALFLGKVLRRIPLDIKVERVMGALAAASAQVRARCAEVLGVLRDVKAMGKLGDLTRDPDEEVRLAAIGALERIGSNRAFDHLAKAVKDVSSRVRERAVAALKVLPDDRAINVLGTALQDRVADVRGAAAAALASIRDRRVVPILLAGLKDEASEVRLSIVNTLGVLGDAAAVKPLIQVLQDINSEVRQAAVRALGKIGDVDAVGPLLKAMEDHDLWVKTEARKTLLAFREESLPKKIEALGSDDEGMQRSAVAILAEVESPKLYGLLLEAFSHRSKDMRANAARVLGRLKEKKAVMPLIHLLDDRDYEVREMAAVALGEIGDISASVALKQAQKDQNKDVRLAAHQALKRIMELVDVG